MAILLFNLDDEQLAYLQLLPGYLSNAQLFATVEDYVLHPQDAYDLLDGLPLAAQASRAIVDYEHLTSGCMFRTPALWSALLRLTAPFLTWLARDQYVESGIHVVSLLL